MPRIGVPAECPPNKPRQQGAGHTDQHGDDYPTRIPPGHQQLGDRTNDQSDNQGPQESHSALQGGPKIYRLAGCGICERAHNSLCAGLVCGLCSQPTFHSYALPVAEDIDLEAFAILVAAQNPKQVGWALRLAPVYRQHHVAPLEAQLGVPGHADDQDPAGSAKVLAQVGVERGKLEVGER